MKRKEKLQKRWIVIGSLIAVDIIIKLIIGSWFMESRFVLADIIGFKPHLNTVQLSILNNELGLGVSISVLIILNLVLLPLIPLSFRWLGKEHELGTAFKVCEDLLMAGAICSLLDKIFWGGSLDYIYLLNRWIVDFKDIYLFGAICAIFIALVNATKHEIKKNKKLDD